MRTSHPSQAADYQSEVGIIRTGNRDERVLLTGDEGSPDNYRLTYSTGKTGTNFETPRHRHVFEQFRYVLAGDYAVAGEQYLPEGWLGYFPESTYYGPQIKTSNLTMISIQFGGPSGLGYMSVAQRKHGRQILVDEGGEFRDGMYVSVDAEGTEHVRDAHEIMWERAMGIERLSFPEPRYNSMILMNPSSFTWLDGPELGVRRKRLGSFSERDIRAELVSVGKGATLSFGTESSAEILFLADGVVEHRGRAYPKLSAFGTAKGDPAEDLAAAEDCTFFYVKLPTF